jgi:LAO/AO transport system kinase
MRARRDLGAALRSLGSRETPIVAVSSIPPPTGIDELVEALDAHRDSLDLAAERARARRLTALSAFAAEHGDRGLRALGGRREAERLVAGLEGSLPELISQLESRAQV